MGEQDEELERIRERERRGDAGPWKWQLVTQLERIAGALESLVAADQGRAPRDDGDLGSHPRPAPARAARKDEPKSGGSKPSADLVVRVPAGDVHGPKPGAAGGGHQVLRAYCDAYRIRYGVSPVITGKVAGLAKNLLRTVSVERLSRLVQAYLQMEDKFFLLKCHDFVTFSENIQRVAVALYHGTADPHEKNYWAQVFGGPHDTEHIPAAGTPAPKQLGGASVQSGTSQPLLEGF